MGKSILQPCAVPALALILVLQSCSVIRTVQVDSPTRDCLSPGQSFCRDTVMRTSIWKRKNDLKIRSGCTNGISRVKVTTRPGDAIVSVLTLGFVVRQRIQWDCAQRSGASEM